MRLKLFVVSIFFLVTLLMLLVFVMLRTTYRHSYEGCGVEGCGVPKECIRPSILEELTNWVGRTQYMR